MQNDYPPTDPRKRLPLKIALYAGLGVLAIMLVIVLAILLFPDPFLNRFIKPRITKAFSEAYPAYSMHIFNMNYSVSENRFGIDSVAVSAVDSTFSSTIGPVSVSGIRWMHLLWGKGLASKDFANSVVNVHDIVVNFPKSHYELRCQKLHLSVPDSMMVADSLVMRFPQSNYEFRCQKLRVSVPDSMMVADSLALGTLAGDDEFFGSSEFRRTRFTFETPQCRVMGLACLELLRGKIYRTRSVLIRDLYLDILVNKEKRSARDTSIILMPNEILSSMKETIQCDSIDITNASLKYGERMAVGSKPALITFDNMHVLAEGIDNRDNPEALVDIHVQGDFMKSGKIDVLMSIPVSSPKFSFQYSGSVSRMDLRVLNEFLERAEQIRIKSGILYGATFDINVSSGHARGYVRAVYRDLIFAVISKSTGSDRGFFNNLVSLIANTFKIRGTNVPSESEPLKIGKVRYNRHPDDPFFGFVWFALRSGLKDVAGF
ncbi:MAG: hypothetical protein HGB11_10910 [Chlorobiales bacterium]|nr:hypothetical protein [Chlorobiales bacterium]